MRRVAALLVVMAAAGAVVLAAASGNGEQGSSARSDRWIALRPSPFERTEVAAARVGRFVYVVGGFVNRDRNSTVASVARYDIRRNRWRRVRSMPLALNHPAAAASGGDLYVMGGYRGPGS